MLLFHQVNKMKKNNLKRALPATVLMLFLMLIVTLSALGVRQKREAEMVQKAEQAQRDAEEKIYLMGKFDPAQREDFILVPQQYTVFGVNDMYLRKETLNAYLQMQDAAGKDGIEIKIASATRNFDYQKNLWNSEWSGVKIVNGENLAQSFPDGFVRFKKILEYVAVPGTSRHHWGTEIDINGANLPYFESETGIREYQWLVKNAGSFGFCQTYRARGLDRRTGYGEEKWHWSYLPLARVFTQEYKRLIKNEDIKGFLGDQYALGQDLVNQYALNINPDCL